MIIFLLCVIAIGVVLMTYSVCPWMMKFTVGIFVGFACMIAVAMIGVASASSVAALHDRFYDHCIGEWSLSKTTDPLECHKIKYEAKATSASPMKGELP